MSDLLPLRLDRISGHTFIPGLLPRNAVVVDLGANRGAFSNAIRRKYGWTCYVVEPNPDLWQNIEEDEGLRKFNVAIGPTDGPVEFHLCANSECSSILPVPGEMTTATIEVQGVTLRTLMSRQGIPRIDLLKVDIEGAEIGLFQSLADEEIQRIGQIAVEFHELVGQIGMDELHALVRRMQSLGFAAFKMSFSHHADVLFVNRRTAGATPLRLWTVKAVNRNLRFLSRFLRRVSTMARR